MFPDDSEIQEILRRIIFCLVGPSEISEDLLQEGLVLIWQMKLSSPDNALGWYRSKCWWFLHDMLKRGRSLDSWKRNAFRAGIPTDEESADCEPAAVELPAAPDDVVELVAARDLFRELSARLDALDRALLELIVEGCTLDEIAQAQHLSASAVRQHRARIARATRRLGI